MVSLLYQLVIAPLPPSLGQHLFKRRVLFNLVERVIPLQSRAGLGPSSRNEGPSPRSQARKMISRTDDTSR